MAHHSLLFVYFFKNHMNNGVIVAVYSPPTSRELHDSADDAVMDWNSYYDSLKDPKRVIDDERDLQVSSDVNRQVLVFESCLFLNNSQGPDNPQVEDGIITALPYNDIVLKSCIFQDNKYSEPKKGVSCNCSSFRYCISFYSSI